MKFIEKQEDPGTLNGRVSWGSRDIVKKDFSGEGKNPPPPARGTSEIDVFCKLNGCPEDLLPPEAYVSYDEDEM